MDFLPHILHVLSAMPLFPIAGFLSREGQPTREDQIISNADHRRTLLGPVVHSEALQTSTKIERDIDKAVADYMATHYPAIAGEADRMIDNTLPNRNDSLNYVREMRASFEKGLRLHLKLQSQKVPYINKKGKEDTLPAAGKSEYPELMAHFGQQFIFTLDSALRRGVSKKTAIKYAGNTYRYDHKFLSLALKMKGVIDDIGGDTQKLIPTNAEDMATLLSEESDLQRLVADQIARYIDAGAPDGPDYSTPPDPEPALIDEDDDEGEPVAPPEEAPQPEPEVTPEDSPDDDEVTPDSTPTPEQPHEPEKKPEAPPEVPDGEEKKKKRRTTGTRRKPQEKRKAKAKTTPDTKPTTPATPAQPAQPGSAPHTAPEGEPIIVTPPAPEKEKEKKKEDQKTKAKPGKKDEKTKPKDEPKPENPEVLDGEILRPERPLVPRNPDKPVIIDGEAEDVTPPHRPAVPQETRAKQIPVFTDRPMTDAEKAAHNKKRIKVNKRIRAAIGKAYGGESVRSLSRFNKVVQAYLKSIEEHVALGWDRQELKDMVPPLIDLIQRHKETYNDSSVSVDKRLKNLIGGANLSVRHELRLGDVVQKNGRAYWREFSGTAEALLLGAFGKGTWTTFGSNETVQFNEFKRRWNLMSRLGYDMGAIAEYGAVRSRARKFLAGTKSHKRADEFRSFFSRNGIV